MSALISFLGGSAFRMVWGEVSAWLTARQEHRFELDRMKAQNDADAAQHARNQEAIRTQHEIGVDTIRVQATADLDRVDADAWRIAVDAVGRPVGIKWVDAWNAVIRPALATVSFAVICIEVYRHGFDLTEWHRELLGAILGIYVADRSLSKRGK